MTSFYKYKDNQTLYNPQNQGVDFNQYKQQGGIGKVGDPQFADVQVLDQTTPALLQPQLNAQPAAVVPATAANGFGTGVVAPLSEYDQLSQQRYANSQAPVDTEAIRKQKISEFQAQIDATNQIFTNLTANAQTQGQGQLGQARALNARSGTLDSGRGQAQLQGVQANTNNIVSGIAGQQQGAITGILGQAQQAANTEIAAKQAAKEQGAIAYLDYLKTSDERKSATAQSVVQSLLQQNLALEDIPPDQLNQLASSLKITPQELQSIYTGEITTQRAATKAANDKAKIENLKTTSEINKNNAEAIKAGQVTLGEGEVLVGADGAVLARGQDKPITLPEGSVILNADGTLKYKNEKTYDPLDQAYKQAQIDKINADISNTGNGVLSDSDAIKLGLNPGSTKSDAVRVLTQQKVDAVNKDLGDINDLQTLINNLKNNPAADGALSGTLGINIARNTPGTASNEFKRNFDKLVASLSLGDSGKLKGQGSITDTERKLLADAASSLNINGGKEAFLREIAVIEEKINRGKSTAEQNLIRANADSVHAETGGSSSTNPKVLTNTKISAQAKSSPIVLAVATKYPDGSVQPPSGNLRGQCAAYAEQLANFNTPGNTIGNHLADKQATVNKYGLKADTWRKQGPKVGDGLILNLGSYGHVSVVVHDNGDGTVVVNDANYGLDGKVQTRTININDPSIYGALRGNLKIAPTQQKTNVRTA